MNAMPSSAGRILRRLLEALGAGEKPPLPAFEDPVRQRFDREYEALLIEMANACPLPRQRGGA